MDQHDSAEYPVKTTELHRRAVEGPFTYCERIVQLEEKIKYHLKEVNDAFLQYSNSVHSGATPSLREEGVSRAGGQEQRAPATDAQVPVQPRVARRAGITEEDIWNWFTYHKPDDEQVQRLATIRQAGLRFAQAVFRNTPPSADQSAAIRLIREAVMTANASIVCEGK